MNSEAFSLPKAAIFDLDGLLINTDDLIFRSVSQILSRHGHTLPPELYGRFLGQSSTIFYKELIAPNTGLSEEDFWKEANAGYDPDEIRLKPGALALLKSLRAHAIPIAIATNSSRKTFVRRTASLDIHTYIELVVTSDDIPNPKPAPDIYKETARRLNVPSNLCMVLEDSEAGIKAGYAAGCRVSFVPNPYISNPASLLVDNPVAMYGSLDQVDRHLFGIEHCQI